jgi:histidine triad (HIT) family protein
MNIDLKNYDPNNIFAKIIRNESPYKKIYEDELVLCFESIAKEAKFHALVVPKDQYISFSDFSAKNSPKVIGDFFQTVNKIAQDYTNGQFKIISNIGSQASQIIPHFHVHIISQNLK